MTPRGFPPRINETSRPWWDALAVDQVSVQRCDACHRFVFYPRVHCPHCGATRLTWERLDGKATLYTWSVAESPVSAGFAHLKRPILAVAELARDVRVPTVIVQATPEDVRIGMALVPVFDREVYEGVTVLHFRPA